MEKVENGGRLGPLAKTPPNRSAGSAPVCPRQYGAMSGSKEGNGAMAHPKGSEIMHLAHSKRWRV